MSFRNRFWYLIVLISLVLIGGCGGGGGGGGSVVNEAKKATGLIVLPDDAYLAIPRVTPLFSGELPAAVDMTDLFPLPESQGSQGSCVAWAVSYYKAYQEALDHKWDVKSHRFSPSFIYNQINGGRDGGSRFNDALDLVVDQGAALLEDMPYSEFDWITRPTNAIRDLAKPHAAKKYGTLLSGDIKSELAAGNPVLIGVEVHPDFDAMNEANDTYDSYEGALRGYHAITLIGYDDKRQAYKLINSWGRDWGVGGYGYISYKLVSEHVRQIFVMTDIEERVVVKSTLESIAVTSLPVKTTYTVGDVFSTAGIVMTASYSDGSSHAISAWSASTPKMDQVGAQSIVVSYTEGGITKTAYFSINIVAQSTTCAGENGGTYAPGQQEYLSCPSGQTGSQFHTCQSNGSWGSTSGSCTPQQMTCTGTNGGTYTPGQQEYLSCPSGQTGSQYHTCQSNGSWGSTSGSCTPQQMTCTGTNGGTYTPGQQEYLSCPSGQTGSQYHTCQSNGSWGSTSGSCTPQQMTCTGTNGGTYTPGQQEYLSCPSGQTGSQYHTCQSNGSWGSTSGSCTPQQMTCTGTNGGTYTPGQQEYLSCPSGQTGSQYHTCQSNGSWGSTSGSCVSGNISLLSASKTGNLGRNFQCASGTWSCVQAGVTLSGANFSEFSSIRVTWSGVTGSGSYTFYPSSSQITYTSDTSIVFWPTVFDGTDSVGTCYTWTVSLSKDGVTTPAVSLSTGQICRPAGI